MLLKVLTSGKSTPPDTKKQAAAKAVGTMALQSTYFQSCSAHMPGFSGCGILKKRKSLYTLPDSVSFYRCRASVTLKILFEVSSLAFADCLCTLNLANTGMAMPHMLLMGKGQNLLPIPLAPSFEVLIVALPLFAPCRHFGGGEVEGQEHDRSSETCCKGAGPNQCSRHSS